MTSRRVDDTAAGRDDVDASWREEIGSRIDDIVSGSGEMVDADEHSAQIRARLAMDAEGRFACGFIPRAVVHVG